MSAGDRNKSLIQTALLTAAGAAIVFFVVRKRAHIWRQIFGYRNPLRHKRIEIIETPDECQRVVNVLKSHCASYKVLGFDCEWVSVNGARRPTALLQLSSHQGLCALFRLCVMKQIPKSLRELLEDDDVIKVGVGPQDDAQKLSHDYGVGVASTLDLRFLAAITGHKPEGLAKLSKSLLNVQLDKHWRIACSDWEAKILTERQLQYAANDALVAVEIFKKLSVKLDQKPFWQRGTTDFSAYYSRLEPFFDVHFKDGFTRQLNSREQPKWPLTMNSKKSGNIQLKKQPPQKQQTRSIATRAKVLYDNCFLEAPDGELLCTIDHRKAMWYMDQNLGTVIQTEPLTVRLNFEPAGRAVGEVGQYYQTPKENQCVVCGRRDAYIRKNVVPREYRKHFPVVMKTHTSHDVLLLCPMCHQTSNISDLKVRMLLAERCGAPLVHEDSAVKYFEVPELKQLRSAARALLHNGEKIPLERREKLKQTILDYYTNETELNTELLEKAANVETTLTNENYCQHGEKVVQKYQTDFGGLIELEKLWREHFLNTMKPQFLPALWNVNHNANRLEIRANEGRIDKADLIVAGLDTLALNRKHNNTKT